MRLLVAWPRKWFLAARGAWYEWRHPDMEEAGFALWVLLTHPVGAHELWAWTRSERAAHRSLHHFAGYGIRTEVVAVGRKAALLHNEFTCVVAPCPHLAPAWSRATTG